MSSDICNTVDGPKDLALDSARSVLLGRIRGENGLRAVVYSNALSGGGRGRGTCDIVGTSTKALHVGAATSARRSILHGIR